MIYSKNIQVPQNGEPIRWANNQMWVPDCPIIPIIEGDGIGKEIMRATQTIVDAALQKSFSGKRRIAWMNIHAGEAAQKLYAGEILPDETLQAIQEYLVALKGPLGTPVGKGHRSINVVMRQTLDVYACIRPIRYFDGVASMHKAPEKIQMTIFRENTEDIYTGIEWEKGSNQAREIIQFLKTKFGKNIREDSGIGIKPISEFASKRLIRMALQYALKRNKKSVTIVHKGNIQKFTEGAFCSWGYDVAEKEFSEHFVTECNLNQNLALLSPEKHVIKDRIADNMFQEIVLRPEDHQVIATTNLNGDYLSDAVAALVGGLGIAPGANVGDKFAVFEATHGTAPGIVGKNIANPSSLLLSAAMMLDHIGWTQAADAIDKSLSQTIREKKVTRDLADEMGRAQSLSTTEFTQAIIENL